MAEPMDETVAEYTALATTDASALSVELFTFVKRMTDNLFDLRVTTPLDAEHKAEVAAVNKQALIVLREDAETLIRAIGKFAASG